MTSARSGKESPIVPNARRQHQESKQNGNPCDDLAPLIGRAGEVELDVPSSGRELDPDESVIDSTDGRWLPVHGGLPTRIVVLRDDERCAVPRRRTQIDPHLAWLVMTDARCHRKRL